MIKLWNQIMPHRCPADAFEPYLTPYFCDGAKTAIVVCAGGAYSERVTYEGDDVAVWLNTIGITAFVLEYRVAPSKAPAQPSDAQRAMRLARKLCMEHGIERLGIMGFSAGGHLAASYGVFWKKKTFLAEELGVDAEQLRPNGLLLSYPVITSGPKAHRGSFTNLLGDRYDELVDEMSLENQVSLDTPKTFLWHTAPDDCVPVENSILFFTALHALEIPVEMHIYPVGGHGLGLASEETQSYEYQNAVREECQSWISLALSWMQHL